MVYIPDSLQGKLIPAEEAQDVKPYQLPVIDDQGRVLPSAEKETRDRLEAERLREQEKIEDVDLPLENRAGFSAQELQEIFDAAERDGFAQGEKAGYEKGMADGYAAGQQQGLMEMRQHLLAEQTRFQKLVQSLLHPLEEQDAAIEQMLLETICTLTQAMVERELLTDSGDMIALVQKAVAALPVGSEHLRIYLNPEDLAAVETYARELQLDWTFIADAQLDKGGCRVETSESRVDFSVAKRLEQLLKDFVNKRLVSSDRADESLSPTDESGSPQDHGDLS